MGENKPIFSILTPAFNSESYINRCIDSVLKQDFLDYEMIIVNDGSTDNTRKIIDGYLPLSSKIKVHHVSHGGYCNAMNKLVELASGDYIISLDSDNWFEQINILSTVYNIITKTGADIVQLPYRLVYKDGNRKDVIYPLLERDYFFNNHNGINEGIQKNYIYYRSHGGKAIKKTLFDGLGFFGNPTGADSRVMCLMIARSGSFYCVSNCLLGVDMRDESVSNSTKYDFSFYFDWVKDEILLFHFYEQLLQNGKKTFPQLCLFLTHFEKSIIYSTFKQCFKTKKIRKNIWSWRYIFTGVCSKKRLFCFCKLPILVKMYKKILKKGY